MFASYSGSPSKRLTTLPEVWDAMMEGLPHAISAEQPSLMPVCSLERPSNERGT
jgi:hypothetical protein